MSTNWPALVMSIMKENGVSVRRLAKVTGINRYSVIRFTKGNGGLKIDQLETILHALGYELDCFKVGEPSCSLEIPSVGRPSGKKPAPTGQLMRPKLIKLACQRLDD